MSYSGLASGQHGSCVVGGDGKAYCWEHGDEAEAEPVSKLSNARRVVVGPAESCAIRDGGSVMCWTEASPPEELPGICGASELAVGQLSICAVVAGGEVSCRGEVQVPGLRAGYSEDMVRIPGVTQATALALGPNGYTCALIDDGTVTCWGPWSPSSIAELSGATAISGEGAEVCALLADQTVSCWSLGRAPAPVEGLSEVASLSVGQQHSCAVLSDGTVRCWGTNAYGELGDGTQTNSNLPLQVKGLEGVQEVSVGTRVAFGMGYSCALLGDARVACWGAKTTIALNGDWIASPTPVTMSLR